MRLHSVKSGWWRRRRAGAAGVDRVAEAAARSTDWNDDAEKQGVLDRIAQARAVFAERARP